METLPNTIKPAALGSGFSGGKMLHVKLFYRKTRTVCAKQSSHNKTVSTLIIISHHPYTAARGMC
ncbi:phosphohistidine phosphatase SixA [Ereboglobus sp. PH5-10]|nr:phosphohistidine phosphatase SixA [Ereboglobus sp. PH5-10]